MNELSKTGIFAGIAAVLALLALVTETPTSMNIDDEARERVGEVLFPGFEDSLKVASLKIVKYDEKLGTHDQFEVAKDAQSGVWTLPSNDSYPADAQDQMSRAANSLIGVKILDLASSRNDDQTTYGVVEPSLDKTEVGASGVGTLVRMLNEKGERLAEVIIGKKVAGSETQRYVRIPSNDQIYVAEIDPANFPTDFNQWIDKDLLQLSSTDVRRLDIRKYDIAVQGNRAGIAKQFDAVVDFDPQDGKWKPNKIVRWTNGVDSPRELTADEELNTTKLNAMKTALDSLQIAGVARKPQGLAANLKAEANLLQDDAALMSLQSKGFFVPQGGSEDIYSSSGELLVSLKDGVQYLLRFGDTADTTLKSGSDDDKSKGQEDSSFSINRYLLVTARVDESQIPEVELEKVPQSVEEMDAMEAAQKQSESSANPPASAPEQSPEVSPQEPAPTEPTTAPEASDGSESAEGAAPTSEPESTESNGEASQPPVNDSSKVSNATNTRLVAFQVSNGEEQNAAPAEQPASDASAPDATETAASEPAPADASNAATPAADSETAEEKQERLQALQEKITKANQRKTDERNDKLEAAKKRVAELNSRFAEWYYVISESEYQKLSISMDDMIQNKNAAAAPSFGQPSNGGGFPGLNFLGN